MKQNIILMLFGSFAMAVAVGAARGAPTQSAQAAPPPVKAFEPITRDDRILIMAPHPDDETLGTAGIIQKAVRAGADVRVVYLTNGEHNQVAFIVYEKRIVFKQKAIIQMGELRQQEAIAAMELLGVPQENLIFLGYPDFGTLAIFMRHWGDAKPFKNMLTRVASVPSRATTTRTFPCRSRACSGTARYNGGPASLLPRKSDRSTPRSFSIRASAPTAPFI